VRILLSLFSTAAFALGQSHPSWWTLASPEATAIVGIHWDNLKQSVFAEPIAGELASTGSLGFPDLPCLKEASQILISSPSLLAIVNGPFDSKTVSTQAAAAHMKLSVYNNVLLWISPGKTLSVAQMSDKLLLIGQKKTLEDAIDRDAAESDRHYSPLLARAARFQSTDLWVVASHLPDPLASLFVPIESEAKGFEGGATVRDGLHLEATLDAGSENAAQVIGETLRNSISSLPAVAHDLQVTVESQHVLLTLGVTQQNFTSGLRQPATTAQPAASPTPFSVPAPIASPISLAAPAAVPMPEPTGPQVIRIFGLDDGPREIPLPPPPQ
jgi:hypothetical protein